MRAEVVVRRRGRGLGRAGEGILARTVLVSYRPLAIRSLVHSSTRKQVARDNRVRLYASRRY